MCLNKWTITNASAKGSHLIRFKIAMLVAVSILQKFEFSVFPKHQKAVFFVSKEVSVNLTFKTKCKNQIWYIKHTTWASVQSKHVKHKTSFYMYCSKLLFEKWMLKLMHAHLLLDVWIDYDVSVMETRMVLNKFHGFTSYMSPSQLLQKV